MDRRHLYQTSRVELPLALYWRERLRHAWITRQISGLTCFVVCGGAVVAMATLAALHV